MKNLFKNLMLVAVAAMAFTACTETNDEVNAVSKTTRFEFTANIAEETRSGFAEKEEGATAYKSEWFGNETLKIFVTDYSTYNVETTASINAEGKFDLELTDAPESFFITAVSPAESWASESSYTIPAEQTPLANSVDPKAHLLQAQAVPVSGNSGDINFTHMAAYGKMTVNGVDFAIDHVVVDLKGSYYGYDREYSYTINADNVENNTFWFATEPIDVAEFTVTAFDAESNAVTKTVDVAEAGKTMSFLYGRVGTFSVSGLKKAVEKFDSTYAYVYQDYGATDKEIMFVAEDGRGLRIDFYNVYDNNSIVPGTYTFTGDSRMYPNWSYYYANVENPYTSKLNSGQAVVSVEDGQYKVVFTNMALDGTVYVEQFTFKGQIDGLDIYDSRTPLATPEVTYELNGKTLTVSWTPVDGAVGYYVHDYYYDIDTTTTKTTLTVELSEYKWYYIYVTALAADDNANFKDSYETEISFELKDPRTVLLAPANVNATVDGRYATIEWTAVQGADYYTLYYNLDGEHYIDVTSGTSHTIDVGFDVYELFVYVFAKANDDNLNYKSSTSWDAYTIVKTGSDPSIVPIAFTTCVLNEYIPDQWRVSYNFSDGANNSMTLWLTTDHGATDASLGGTNNYNQFYDTPGSVGNYYRFCPENVVVNGESKTVTGGNVEIESLGTSWNVTMKLTIDGSKQIFTYSGGVGVTGGDDEGGDDSGEFTPDYTINTFSFYRLSTSYYTYQWSVQTSNGLNFSIYTPYSQGNELHEGTYIYYNGTGNTNGDFTFSTRMFSPAPSSGTMVVSKDGNTYTINLTVVVGGTTQKYQYVGTL